MPSVREAFQVTDIAFPGIQQHLAADWSPRIGKWEIGVSLIFSMIWWLKLKASRGEDFFGGALRNGKTGNIFSSENAPRIRYSQLASPPPRLVHSTALQLQVAILRPNRVKPTKALNSVR
jgi:hypothetical protein